ncbi:hypothetical protein [Rhodoblastus sp.]|uniref:hypothetical protein n=1 Tax=Rhodoblastus sp. TaxID=1962975 RepID=UPI003F9C2FA2
MGIPNESFGIPVPLARKSAGDIEDFRAMAFLRMAKQSCGNRLIEVTVQRILPINHFA